MRKIVSIIMVMIMVLTPMKASAAEYSTYDLSSCNKTSALTISNSTATCRSVFLGSADVSKVKVEQHLQKKSLLIWSNVSSFSTTITGKNASFTNTKSSLSSGSYRLKSVFTVTMSDGQTETVTVYSDTKTV